MGPKKEKEGACRQLGSMLAPLEPGTSAQQR